MKFQYRITAMAFAAFLLQATSAMALDVHITNAKDKEDIAVILKPIGSAPEKPASSSKDIQQKNFAFNPKFSIIHTGTSLRFPNKDAARHHVYSFSEAKSFDFKLFSDESPSIDVNNEGVIVVGCNIHDWMEAYILSVDTPYFTMTDDDGIASFQGLASGEYKVGYWRPGMDPEAGVKYIGKVASNTKAISIEIEATKKYRWPRKPVSIEDDY